MTIYRERPGLWIVVASGICFPFDSWREAMDAIDGALSWTKALR